MEPKPTHENLEPLIRGLSGRCINCLFPHDEQWASQDVGPFCHECMRHIREAGVTPPRAPEPAACKSVADELRAIQAELGNATNAGYKMLLGWADRILLCADKLSPTTARPLAPSGTPAEENRRDNMRVIEDHHDGHGLNESIRIEADDLGPGGASHRYSLTIGGEEVARVQFQRGPRNVAGSTPGVTEAALLAVLIDRLRCFNAGEYACRENAIQITKLEEALHWTKARADARAKRGVLGSYAK